MEPRGGGDSWGARSPALRAPPCPVGHGGEGAYAPAPSVNQLPLKSYILARGPRVDSTRLMSTLSVDGERMADDYELLTYKEIAARLGIKLVSARQTVSRKGWLRQRGNDGAVRIRVPLSYLQRESDGVDERSVINVDVDIREEVVKLRAENDFLRQRVADLEVDRDRWHEMAVRPWWRRLMG